MTAVVSIAVILLAAPGLFAGGSTDSVDAAAEPGATRLSTSVDASAPLTVGQWATVAEYTAATGNRITSYQEAPILASLVGSGSLPAVDARLPEEPMVVEPFQSVGQYGGSWRRVATRPTDNRLSDRMGYEPPVRFARDAATVVGNVAKSWEASSDGRQFTFFLRPGMQWSDGTPLTADDFLFRYDHHYGNEELYPNFPSWLVVGGEPGRLDKIDDYTVRFTFADSFGLFLPYLAFQGRDLVAPAHYLQQYHPAFTDRASLERQAKNAGYDSWINLFGNRAEIRLNPEHPTFRAWKLATEATAQRQIAERNAYYWKVDTQGNQLPYIDRVTYDMVESAEIANLKAMAGELDMHSRYMMLSNYTLFVENSDKNDFQVHLWKNPAVGTFYLNLSYVADPVLNQLYQERDFRRAVSYAIDRQEIADLAYLGVGEPWSGLAFEEDPYHVPSEHAKYDPETANQLLDSIGLTERNSAGIRLRSDGEPLTILIESYGAEEAGGAADELELLGDHLQDVGINVEIKIEDRSLWTVRGQANEQAANLYLADALHWAIGTAYYVPVANNTWWAPGYGEWFASGGKSGVEPPPAVKQLQQLHEQLRTATDDAERIRLGKEIQRSHAENVWFVGTVRYPAIAIVKNSFKNVPANGIQSWPLMAPGYLNPEQFYIEQ